MKGSIPLRSLSGIALLSLIASSHAQNISQLISESNTCDAQCQQLVQLAITFEHDSHANTPLDDFYSIPASFNSSVKPGTLLRLEPHTNLTNYTVPSGLSMSRILYASQSLNGTVVPASAFVLWPYKPFDYTNGGKWQSNQGQISQSSSRFPLVAWAHGTAGSFKDCAPSNYRSLQYNFMTSYSLALEGFAVVATDYAGLGVTTRPNGEQSHEYLAGPAGANDVAYAVDAARNAFPDQFDKDGPFVAMGHSQGGGVAWAFAERQAVSPQAGYRGTVTISPAIGFVDLINDALQLASTAPLSLPLWAQLVIGLQPKVIAAITTVFPSYNSSGMTDISYDRWYNVVKPLQGCLPTDSLAFASVTDFARPGWTNNSLVQKWKDAVAVSGKKFKGPLLVLVGDSDVIPVDKLKGAVNATCKVSGDQSLEMSTYQSMEHFPVIQASRMQWISWVKEKITGNHGVYTQDGQSNCGRTSLETGFNTNYTVHGVPPNWIVEWTPPELGWELSL